MVRVTYGIRESNEVDVTEHVLVDGWFVDPGSDQQRYQKFKTDPVPGKIKYLNVYDGDERFVASHPPCSFSYKIAFTSAAELTNRLSRIASAERGLADIHKTLMSANFSGDLRTEYPEQVMSWSFVDSTAQVLEIGANVGRNTCVIASLLGNPALQLTT